MKTAFKLPEEYSNTDFILSNEYAVEESIKEKRNLFRIIKISHDNNGNTREEKQFTLYELDNNLKEPHKINSCITLNNNEHKRAWELFLEVNRSLYSNETESGMNLKRYLNSVMLVFESWFGKHALKSQLLIKRLIHNRNFRSVIKGNSEFSLTEQQSLVIKYLYELAIQGIPSTTSSDVISYVDEQQGIYTSNKRLVDIFKKNKDAYKALIIRVSDTIKLKID